MSILDRYILKTLAGNYLIAMGVMISLYVVLDMFVNMDEFTEHGRPMADVIADIIGFYSPNVLLYFKQLCPTITLFACMITLAKMRKQNELGAILSSGVSLYRVAAPIIAFGVFASGLLIVNNELLIPKVAPLLSRQHDEVGSGQAKEVMFMPDRGNALLSAGAFDATAGEMRRLLVVQRNEQGDWSNVLQADLAIWEEDESNSGKGRWRLERSAMRAVADDSGDGAVQGTLEETYPRYYESDLTPGDIQLRQSEQWVRFMSLAQLSKTGTRSQTLHEEIVRAKHQRIASPIISLVLLLLGLPFFLDRAPDSILGDATKCMIVCGLCFATTFISQSLRPSTLHALPYWIPIFIFATVAAVLIDRVRT